MGATSREILKSWFETLDTPTQAQFASLIDSFHHIEEDIYLPLGKALYVNGSKVIGAQMVSVDLIDSEKYINDSGALTGDYNHDMSTLQTCILDLVKYCNNLNDVLKRHGLTR
jgi:hypothetical protein